MNRGSWKWRRGEAVLYREALDDVVILVPRPEAEPFALAGGALERVLMGTYRGPGRGYTSQLAAVAAVAGPWERLA